MKTRAASLRREAPQQPRLEAYTDDKLAEWDAFVTNHPLAGQGHLSSNFRLAQSRYGARNRSLVLHDGNGALLGILPLFELPTKILRAVAIRELKSGVEFPGGPLVKEGISSRRRDEALDALLRGARRLAESENMDRVAIGYPNVAGRRLSIDRFGYLPLKQYGYRERNDVFYYLDLNSGEEDLFNRLKENCRRNIRAARSAGAKARPLRSRDEWMSCHTHSLETLSEANLAWSREDMAIVWDEFIAPGHAGAVAVTAEDRIASVVVVTHVHAAGYYWIGLNRKPYIVRGANHYALWEAILRCREKGAAIFEVGSKSFDGDKLKGISSFKERFGGSPAYALSGVLELKPVKRRLLETVDLGLARAACYFRRAPARAETSRPDASDAAAAG